MNTKLFKTGLLLTTRGVNERQAEENGFASYVHECLARHCAGDWGDVCEEDKQANEEALKHGSRILSSYGKDTDEQIWIITEADRSATTVLFPYEY